MGTLAGIWRPQIQSACQIPGHGPAGCDEGSFENLPMKRETLILICEVIGGIIITLSIAVIMIGMMLL